MSEENIDFFIDKTAQAVNSSIALDVLRNNIRKDRLEKLEKKKLSKKKYDNELINKIGDYLYAVAPKHDFWEILLDMILTDMQKYEFEKSHSVNRNDKHIFSFLSNVSKDMFQIKLGCFYKVTLLQHTLNLFEVYHEILKDFEGFKNINVFELLLACLLHDFGKNLTLQSELSNKDDRELIPHQIISERYIERTIVEFTKIYRGKFNTLNDIYFASIELLENVKKAVREHHITTQRKAKELVDLLITVDKYARDYEWRNYLRDEGINEQ